ncbi:hypothetical protein [Moraxella oblonga]|uniref:hypothetical protein n=1 Tax=Moraxella oblonga TaxID=200413 RepID=UPI0012ED4CE9|nr:hypothetical protein [Moraxella oblonga]
MMIDYFISTYYTIKDNLFITIFVFSFLVILYFIVDFYNFVIIGLPVLVAYIFAIIQSSATGAGLFMVFMFLPHYIVEFYVSKTVSPTTICGEISNIRLVSDGRSSKEVF